MKSTSLQLRKINLVECLLVIQDEKLFTKVEANIYNCFKSLKPNDIIFTKDEIIKRAEFSTNKLKKVLF